MQVGIHHITGITRNPGRNVAFYTHDLGLRLIKKTVNFDYPGIWQLYFGNECGHPGTIFSFFAWTEATPGRNGAGMAVEVGLTIPEDAIGYWCQRLVDKKIPHDPPEKRFGATVLPLRDPDGTRLELVATPHAERLPGWSNGDVPADRAVRGLHGVTLWVENPEATVAVLTGAFAFCAKGREGNIHRLSCDRLSLGAVVDIRVAPGLPAGRQGSGSLHHVAFRAADDASQRDIVAALHAQGVRTTDQFDRRYYRSVYFREPGGALFELATDGPGFVVDESLSELGSALKLPQWQEALRAEIEAKLPPLS
jgi:glyoxalase family protein